MTPQDPSPSLWRKRLPRLALASALGLVLLAAIAWMLRPAPIQVALASVRQAPFEVWIEEEARTRVRERHGIHAPVGGHLLRLSVTEGDWVDQGAVIARIQPALPSALDLRSRRIQEAAVASAQAALEGATVRLTRAQAALAQSRADLERIETLAARGFIAASRVESERLAHEGLLREREVQQASQEAARQELARTRAGLIDPSTQTAGSGPQVEVLSPVQGVVLKRHWSDRSPVPAGTLLVDLGDTRSIEVIADLLTTQAVQVQPGQRVELSDWGTEDRLRGEVARIEPGAFTKVSALGVEEQRVRVVIRLQTPIASAARALGDGWRLQARILIRSLEPVLQLPSAAVFPWPGPRPDTGPRLHGAFVAVKGRARLRSIEIIDRNDREVALRGGLAEGEAVVLYPPPRLRDGDRLLAEP